MEQEVTVTGSLDHDFSTWSMITGADIIVQGVMLLLVVMSVWSWAIMIEKAMTFSSVNSKAGRFERAFWSGRPLEELYRNEKEKNAHPMSRVFLAGMDEFRRGGTDGDPRDIHGLSERVDKVAGLTVNRELQKVQNNLSVLATIGSAAPFIGLFGTVWGILNAFRGIGATGDASLAVVAPGIAEALFATALGLVAAIPAVIGYNRYAASLNAFAVRLEGFADEFSTLVSRKLAGS